MEDDRIRDDISKGFADPTALLEGAACLAAEGQSRSYTVEELEYLAALIWPEVANIVRVLAIN